MEKQQTYYYRNNELFQPTTKVRNVLSGQLQKKHKGQKYINRRLRRYYMYMYTDIRMYLVYMKEKGSSTLQNRCLYRYQKQSCEWNADRHGLVTHNKAIWPYVYVYISERAIIY